MAEKIYSSVPLESGRIRLLRIWPGHVSSTISCDLLEEALNDKPEFEALSYVWGDVNVTGTIELCNHEWSVTANLLAALRHLRHDRDPRVLWVDALCINQSSALEINHQVAQMSSVYTQASKVIAWLGEGSNDNNAAVDAIEEITKAPTAHWYGDQVEGNIDRIIKRYNWFEGIKYITSCPWWQRVWTFQEAILAENLMFAIGWRYISLENLTKMCGSWVLHTEEKQCCRLVLGELKVHIQNVLQIALWRGQRAVSLHQDLDIQRREKSLLESRINLATPGPRRDPYMNMLPNYYKNCKELRELQVALTKKYENFLNTGEKHENADHNFSEMQLKFFRYRDNLRDQILDVMAQGDELRRMLFAAAPESSFLDQRIQSVWSDILRIVHECKSRKCTDRRDYVYGYSGLRSLVFKSLLLPDHSFPAYKVWEDFQLEVICRSRSLDVFSLFYPLNVRRDITWLVNWDIPDIHENITRERIERLSWFKASGTTTSKVKFVHPRALSVRGFTISTVSCSYSSHIVPGSDATWKILREWWELLNLDQFPNQGDVNGQSLSSGFCYTLMSYSSSQAEEVLRNAGFFEARLKNGKPTEAAKKDTKKGQLLSWAKLRTAFQFKRDQAMLDEEPSQQLLIYYAKLATYGRQLIKSVNGHVGLTTIGAQEGDLICILFGARLPFILQYADRRADEREDYPNHTRYHVVGEAYIHGLMQGEAMQVFKDKSLPEHEFLLV
jgi:hypothetical protein